MSEIPELKLTDDQLWALEKVAEIAYNIHVNETTKLTEHRDIVSAKIDKEAELLKMKRYLNRILTNDNSVYLRYKDENSPFSSFSFPGFTRYSLNKYNSDTYISYYTWEQVDNILKAAQQTLDETNISYDKVLKNMEEAVEKFKPLIVADTLFE